MDLWPCHDGYYDSMCKLVTLVSGGHTCHTASKVVTALMVEDKDLGNNGIDGYYGFYIWRYEAILK